jgi:hypothetical protein
MVVLIFRALMASLVLAVSLAVCDAHAETLRTLDDALAATFPGARLEARTLVLGAAEQRSVAKRARARCEARLVTAHVAWRGDSLVGAAYTDRRVVRTREALLFVAVGADSAVARVEVLAFFEPSDYRPSPRWLDRFRGQRQGPRLTPGNAIPNLSGATLTSRAVTESARLALAWHELLLLSRLAVSGPAPRRAP